MKRPRQKTGESGFALLLVFVMAAAIAITLYIEVPRIAFESQRAREQMAIDRGLQYKRAIQLFYRKYQIYPQTLDDLETSRNIRFLRHRYLDPLTGKDWRLLHVGPAGQLTDSLIQPPAPLPGSSTGNGPNAQSSPFSQNSSSSQNSSAFQNSGSSLNFSGQAANSSQQGGTPNPNDPNAQPPDPLNMALRRPSDRIIGAGGAGGVPGGFAPGGYPGGDQPPITEPEPGQPAQPIQQPVPGQPGFPVQQPGDPNAPNSPNAPLDPALPVVPGLPGVPGDPNVPGQPIDPSQPSPSQPAQAPQPPVQFPPGLIPQQPGSTPGFPPTPGLPSGPSFGQPVTPPQGAPAQSASNLIQQILTQPRQPPSATSGFTTGNTGGIAGVASTAEGKGIHVINDHAKYKEWEFVYDLKKDKTVVGAAAVNAQQNVQQQMQQNQNGGGPLSGSPFGSSSTSSSPFSSSPTSSPNSGGTTAPTTAPPTQ